MATVSLASDLRSVGDEELVTRLTEAKEELFNLRFQVATGQLDNNARLRSVRRSIARIYTVMRERELGIEYVAVEAAPAAEKPKAEKATKAEAPVAEALAETVAETTPESGE